ncbi:DUF1573 domain-containing protein [Phaeodactylibacter xiamenensis]|jgi:hypothetical protein|uniref:DUF1573 domain-containing protein n=1 Tax=Phaeodactylibacter xiamenensis TaxID=1524460 RepID=A0A098RZQ3_9BACT|nr:DUF1573 domain-containing protein [Phaeodactylibacter xiamenensis]KGE85639.1 hypothetical protein IX84_26490 [Phaeodactylibacter xiamenensis]MCR9053585.1 DUF1573 domain-containing protein [bacterium]
MLKQIKVLMFALLAVGFVASCNNSESAAQEEAREDLSANTVQPADQAAAQPAAAQPAAPAGPTTTMTFEETEFDFGTVNEGEKVSHTYTFTNTGDEPLILSNAKGSCGCTVPSWPREPIAPGATGEITVEFNSKNKKGKRNQKVTITANTNPPQSFIYLKGDVTPAAGDATPAVTQ